MVASPACLEVARRIVRDLTDGRAMLMASSDLPEPTAYQLLAWASRGNASDPRRKRRSEA